MSDTTVPILICTAVLALLTGGAAAIIGWTKLQSDYEDPQHCDCGCEYPEEPANDTPDARVPECACHECDDSPCDDCTGQAQ